MSDETQDVDRFILLAAQLAQQNPPGRATLAYRSRTYTTAYLQMLSNLRTHRNLSSDLPALQLSTDETHNWTLGLLQSWAMVVDVLTFYQERIANEGFWRTATERRSILELARTIGYELRPGVAASTYLAFSVRETADAPGRRVLIPTGTAVQSVPAQGQQTTRPADVRLPATSDQRPQIFETVAPFEARPEWNELLPASPSGLRWPDIWQDDTSLRMAGVKTGLKNGDTLLIVGAEPGPDQPGPVWMLAGVKTVEPMASRGYTLVTFEREAAAATAAGLIPTPLVFALRQKAALRAYDQGGVHFTRVDQAKWLPTSLGLPNTAVNVLLQNDAGCLWAGTDKGMFRSSDRGNSWEEINSGLVHAKIQALAIAADHQIFAGTDLGALYVSTNQGDNWNRVVSRPAPRGLSAALRLGQSPAVSLPKSVIHQLSTCTENGTDYLIAATGEGVFVSADQGGSWIAATSDQSDSNANPEIGQALTSAPTRWKNLVGTHQGVFPIDLWGLFTLKPLALVGALLGVLLLILTIEVWAFGGYSVNDVPGRPILALLASLIEIGLAALLWVRPWRPRLAALGQSVQALAATADNTIFAGTENGVYRWDDKPKRWRSINAGLLKELFTVETGAQPDLLDEGLLPDELRQSFEQNDIHLSEEVRVIVDTPHERWTIDDHQALASYPLRLEAAGLSVERPFDVRVLTLDPQGVVYAGTQEGRVFRSQDNGDSWSDFSSGLNIVNVHGLVVQADGLFAAGLPASNDPDRQWQYFQLQSRQIDLDKAYSGLIQSGWLILRQADNAVLYSIGAVATVTGRGGKKLSSFTSLQVDRLEQLSSFDRRGTVALVQSEPLSAFDGAPIMGTEVTVDGYVPDLEAGHSLIVSGQRLRLRLVDPLPADAHLISADGLRQRPLTAGDVLHVLAPPVPANSTDNRWRLRDRAGFVGETTLSAGQVRLQPADVNDEVIGELSVVRVSNPREQTTLTVRDPLQNMYDRSTVRVYANIVPATHGQTINNEVLGNVNQTSGDLSFILKSTPLTYVPAPTARGIQAALAVQVNQVAWHEAPSLYELNGAERAYLLRQEANGQSALIFGNGRHGARLPSGTGNVTATYRTGSGAAGNLPAGSLTMLRTRPPGMKVTNPLPATGGVEPETIDHARASAPQQVRTLHRLVALQDYEDFARAFAGIGKAQARLVWDGRIRRLHITIAGEGGAALEPASSTYGNLTAAMATSRATDTQPFQIDSFEPVYFNVKAALIVDPDDALGAEGLVATARQALIMAFSFEQRDFGQSASAAEILYLLQRVTGVTAVELEALYLTGAPEAAEAVLEAQPARLSNGKVLPAQLLLINSVGDTGIDLSIQSQAHRPG